MKPMSFIVGLFSWARGAKPQQLDKVAVSVTTQKERIEAKIYYLALHWLGLSNWGKWHVKREKVPAMALSGSVSLLSLLASPDSVCPSGPLISGGVSCDPRCLYECSAGRRHIKAGRGAALLLKCHLVGWHRALSQGRKELEVCEEAVGQSALKKDQLWSS